jgi:hypothetical protein
MSFPDLSFVEIARELEVEAVDGGRASNELTLDPGIADEGEDAPVVGRSIDDVEETQERTQAVKQYGDYARRAFEQRGLTYPFQASAAGDSLEVLPGAMRLAKRTAELSSMVRQGDKTAKLFEKTAFRTLHALAGGWGVCMGHPRERPGGPRKAIPRFRELLQDWECGSEWPGSIARSGDHGADGFLVLGRCWGGPVFFFQAKNVNFSIREYPTEFGRMSEIFNDWFGTRIDHFRGVVPVFAVNTVLTIENKAAAFQAGGVHGGVHIIDAVDILCFEFVGSDHPCRKADCVIF